MEQSFRQSMRWLHTWSGLLVGWLLFAVFVTGTSAYYKDETTLWMKPELHFSKESTKSFEIAHQKVIELAQHQTNFFVTLPNERSNTISAMWREQGEQGSRGRRVYKNYDASTGEELISRETAGGHFLYRFHFELYNMPRHLARWIVGIATMFMFVAIITGVIIHKRIFKDMFLFRPKKGVRSWMDVHILPAVAALPFHIMITYSGLLLFMRLMMPWGMDAAYKNDFRAYRADITQLQTQNLNQSESVKKQRPAKRKALKEQKPQQLTPETLNTILQEAQSYWPNNIGGYSVSKTKRGIEVQVRPKEQSTIFSLKFEREYLVFDGQSGELLKKNIPPTTPSSILNTLYVFESLHQARFADSVLRFLFFIAGISGCVLIGSGLIIWVVKRKKKYEQKNSLGFTLVEKLNLGTIVGLFIGIGAYFIANRLISVMAESRSSLEIKAFFITWLLSYIHAFVRETRHAWIEQLYATALIYISLPLINVVILTPSWKEFVSRDSIVHYFDIYFIFSAIVFILSAYILSKKFNLKKETV
ncbi:PepSY-associated TM helix domain-containing protein [Candidatus Marinarcus aquaticus]|uniref:PepSY domain-containing protein n=1 Tax=Candidatus Marinarcus aquaticus TaxID=2044504 RepID=A0A4Q0XPS6_9BACT|nr:PepSY-associated TM helix domain-containing protein [Candidatus Marinarcus aquaticus]RXJ57548.1 hypothetical protein CRV04_06980 [Candidatus Marinarcus aquaticus]